METKNSSFVISEIGSLITLENIAKETKTTDFKEEDLGLLANSWLSVTDGKVSDYGTGTIPPCYQNLPVIDAKGGLVMPGLIDCHTHPIYGGSRAKEFAQRLGGITYQEIAAQGGGIKYTVKETQNASKANLKKSAFKRLQKFLRNGVTTVEVKSGYGLTVKDELKLLEALNELNQEIPQHLEITCLALHAVPPSYSSTEEFVKIMSNELLPEVKKQNLATWADAFVEKGYFDVAQTTPYMEKAKELGFQIRIHADEFIDTEAALHAAKWGAKSADHLECASVEGIKAMAKQSVVAVLLPGTSLYTKIPYTKAKPFIENSCPIALSTDFNPGSSQIDNLAFIATLGALHCGLNLTQTIAAVTYVPAFSLNLHKQKGALAKGYDADILIYPFKNIEEWISALGQTQPTNIFIKGIEY